MMELMSNDEIADDAKTAERATDVVTIMAEAFDALAGTGAVQVDHARSHVFKAVFGWWAGITRNAQAVVLLHQAGLAHESAPIVRSILQHTLVMQWVVDTGDEALNAIVEYDDESKRNLIDTMKAAGWPFPTGIAPERPSKPDKAHPLINKVKYFDQLCIPYKARKLYVAYRVLSGFSHPTAKSAEAYIDESGTLASRATSESHGFLIQTAMCLIQAAHIVTPLMKGDPLHDAVTNAQERFGTEIGLWPPPSEAPPARTRGTASGNS